MIKEFENTALASFFDYNDPLIAAWADNVYEKLRQRGELADYIERDKRVRDRFNAADKSASAPIAIKDYDFTFGYAYCGTKLVLVDSLVQNLEKVFQIEFEIKFMQAEFNLVKMFDSYIEISDGQIKVGSLTFTGLTFVPEKLHKFKIVRNHIELSVYLDDVLVGQGLLSNDGNTQFNILYQTTGALPPAIQPDFNKDFNTDYLSQNL